MLFLACSRLSVSEDDRKSERATSGISCERDPGVKRRGRRPLFLYQIPLVARPFFQSSTLTERLEQASYFRDRVFLNDQWFLRFQILPAWCCQGLNKKFVISCTRSLDMRHVWDVCVVLEEIARWRKHFQMETRGLFINAYFLLTSSIRFQPTGWWE